MSILDDLFGKPVVPPGQQNEFNKLVDELITIGSKEDFLSERPGGGFNMQCRHIRTRQIGQRIYELGGVLAMDKAMIRIRKKLGRTLGEHLLYAWAEIGNWMP